jgi:hypothetical protein
MTDPAIYHITHVDNLPRILGQGRLWCDAQRIARAVNSTNIGYSHIKARRLHHRVTVASGGTLGDYVPFNFCPRSVMLYVVSRGHDDYTDGQRPIVHLVSSVHTIIASGRPWFFTDRHADLGYAQQFDTLADLPHVDWTVMPLRQWGGDQDVKEKRRAEFLVHQWCPWTAISAIGVIDDARASEVEQVLGSATHKPSVEVHRDWYY